MRMTIDQIYQIIWSRGHCYYLGDLGVPSLIIESFPDLSLIFPHISLIILIYYPQIYQDGDKDTLWTELFELSELF